MKKATKRRIQNMLENHFGPSNTKVTKGMIRTAKKVYNRLPSSKQKMVG